MADDILMNTISLLFWSRLLQVAAALVIALSAVLLPAPALGGTIFNVVYFHQPAFAVAIPAQAEAYIRFVHGVLGAVMAGWMLAVIALARGPFAAGQRHAWNTIASSVGGWFLIDTTFSAAHGVWGNVGLNVATAMLFAAPLLGSHRHFTAGR